MVVPVEVRVVRQPPLMGLGLAPLCELLLLLLMLMLTLVLVLQQLLLQMPLLPLLKLLLLPLLLALVPPLLLLQLVELVLVLLQLLPVQRRLRGLFAGPEAQARRVIALVLLDVGGKPVGHLRHRVEVAAAAGGGGGGGGRWWCW